MSKVLIIDDNVVVTNMYGSTLRMAGHTVEVAHDGDAGLSAVVRFKPDVVLLDLAMPKSNGLQVLAGIRSNPESATVPVIVFSNTYTNERLEQVWAAGASQVLAKSSSTPRQVTEAVRTSLAAAEGSNK